jgi:hypothetical protein
VQVSHDYRAPVAVVRATLVDPAFLNEVAARYGGLGTPEVVVDSRQILVTTRRQIPLDKVPSAARGLVGDGVVTQVDTWPEAAAEPATGSWHATLAGAPVTLAGDYLLEPAAGGCRYTVTGDVQVKVPLIGGRIADQVRGYLTELVTKQLAFAEEWLDRA